jgi:hypothetical protein
MPNAIKYKTGNLTGSISTGNVALGVNESVVGPTETTGWYNGLTPSSSYVVYEVAESGVPKIYQPNNDTELIQFARSKGATGANTGSVVSVLSWATSQNDIMVVNKAYPSIVTDGLVLNLDAGFAPSYPTTGTSWYDLSGNNNGTLTNGPTFNSSGWIEFDGVDDHITISSPGSFSNYTISFFTKWISTISQGRLFGTNASGTYTIRGPSGINFHYNPLGGSPPSVSLSSNTSVGLNIWTQVTVTVNSIDTSVRIYINGLLKNSNSIIPSVNLQNTIFIGSGPSSQGLFSNCAFGSAYIYNKPLSQQEILQNYYQAPIVTDGLVFAVDAGNLVSYESGSAATYSLTGSNSGSFTNGTSYSNINSGVFVFDGVDDYINVSNPQSLNPGTGSFSLDFWCNVSINVPTSSASCLLEARGTGLYGFLAIGYRNNGRMQLFINDNVTPAQNVYQSTTTPVQRGVWIHEAMVVDRSTQQITFYYNGIQTGNKVTITDTGSIDPGSGYNYRVGGDLGGSEMNGFIAISRQYNKALSSSEVAQNFNAQRSRFGI